MKNFFAFKFAILAVLFMLLTAETCEVTKLSAPCTVTPGVPFPIVATVVNHGTLEGVIPVYYTIGYDRFDNPEDILVGEDNIQLGPYGFQTSVLSASLENDVYSGKYFIIAKPYSSNAGMMYREIEVTGQPNNGADYVPTNLRIEGDRFFFTLENVGLLEAVGCSVHGYLSKDLVVDANDSLVYSKSTGFSMPGKSRRELNAVIDTPAGLPFGTYYFIIAADATNGVSETVESNNYVSKPFYISDNFDHPVEERAEASVINTKSPLSIAVSPNPASEYINITFRLDEPAIVSYQVYDQAGRIVSKIEEQELGSGDYSQELSLREVPNGVYFAQATVNGEPVTKKIVVQR